MQQRRSCLECGAEFTALPSSPKKFCSFVCHTNYRKKLFEEKKGNELLTCEVCGEKYYVIPYRRDKSKYCSYKCHQIGEGRKAGAIAAERQRRKSEGKTYTKTNGRHTHRSAAEELIGRQLSKGEVVHHIDGNKLNNNPDNLMVLTHAEHARLHMRKRWENKKKAG
jgi:Na+-translocating ferredoxin:NAD+ oxidoreductase RnfC subunit